jgi:protein HOOK3
VAEESALRESVDADTTGLERQITDLKDLVAELKEKELLHWQEAKRYMTPSYPGLAVLTLSRLMMDKIELQTSGLSQRDEALEQERKLRWVCFLEGTNEVMTDGISGPRLQTPLKVYRRKPRPSFLNYEPRIPIC